MAGINTWNGSSWVSVPPIKKWNGSSWVDAPANKWNGSSWEQIWPLSMIGADWSAASAPPTTAYSISSVGGITQTATLRVQTDGTFDLDVTTGTDYSYDWADDAPSTTGSDYQIKWDYVSGDTPNTYKSGWTDGVWSTLSAEHYVGLIDVDSGISSRSGYIDVTIRYGSDASTEVTRRIQITANYTT